MTNETKRAEDIAKLKAEIEKLSILINKMNEQLAKPFLGREVRMKYNAAIKECEKKIKMFKGDIRAIEILSTMDIENIELPKHYQHHGK